MDLPLDFLLEQPPLPLLNLSDTNLFGYTRAAANGLTSLNSLNHTEGANGLPIFTSLQTGSVNAAHSAEHKIAANGLNFANSFALAQQFGSNNSAKANETVAKKWNTFVNRDAQKSDFTDLNVSAFAAAIWKHIELTRGSRSQFKQVKSFVKYHCQKFGIPSPCESNSHFWPHYMEVLTFAMNSAWWALSKKQEKKAALISPEDAAKIAKYEPTTLEALRHKFVHVLTYYGISRFDDV